MEPLLGGLLAASSGHEETDRSSGGHEEPDRSSGGLQETERSSGGHASDQRRDLFRGLTAAPLLQAFSDPASQAGSTDRTAQSGVVVAVSATEPVTVDPTVSDRPSVVEVPVIDGEEEEEYVEEMGEYGLKKVEEKDSKVEEEDVTEETISQTDAVPSSR